MVDLRHGVVLCLLSYFTLSSAVISLRQHGCSPYADVVFILDGSESISHKDFNTTKNYVKGEIKRLNVFPDGANVGVVVYSNEVSETIPFSDSRNVEELERRITAIKQPRVGTNTAAALREANWLFGRGRPDATKIIVLITDGDTRETAPPRAEADAVKRNNVSIIAVGVGPDVMVDELKAMASKPEYVKEVKNFAGLDMLRIPYHEVCPPGTTTPFVGSPDDCRLNGTLVFIFDGSESISVDEERIMKNFINRQIDELQLGADRARMGLVMFSNDATVEIELSSSVSASRLKSDVNSLRLPSQGSNIASGIETARDMFVRYGRRSENRIAVLITDGVSMDKAETTEVARRARADGIEIYAIGVGSEGQIDYDELNRIASSPDFVFTSENFDDFSTTDLKSKLSRRLDCTTPTTPTTPTTSPLTPSPTPSISTLTPPTPSPPTPPPPTPPPRTPSPPTPSPPTPSRSPPTRITTTRPGPVSVGPVTQGPYFNETECKDCRIKFGAGFARHPQSCEKFLRCSIETLANGQVRAFGPVVFDCPAGLFWDQEDTLTCRYPYQVNCPLDKCRTTAGLRAYGDPTDCGVYFACQGDYTLAKRCCNVDQRFDEGRQECVTDSSCISPYCHRGPGGGVCHLTADTTDESYYFVQDNGIPKRQRCPAGVGFQPSTCGCHKRIPLPTQRVVTGCEPDVYLPFDNDVRDHSGWDRGVGNSGVTVEDVGGAIGGGAGKFDGTDAVWIYRYNNMEFPAYVLIKFRFREEAQTSGSTDPEALVTNGNCGDDPSIAISSERRSKDVSYHTETQTGEGTTQTSYGNGWTDVEYVYDRRQLAGTSGTSTQSLDLSGIIRRTRSPIIIGHGQGFQNFTGYIDEFYVYFCEP